MKVLLVGGGGREHALAWQIRRSARCDQLWCAPGNPGIAGLADLVPLATTDVPGLVEFARANRPDLVVVGPEAPLVAGLADRLAEVGIATFGPTAAAAAIEGSKTYAKALMARRGVPTAAYRCFDRWAEAAAYLDERAAAGVAGLVVKASGLAAGKGAVVCDTIEAARTTARAMLVDGSFGAAGAEIVIEEQLEGEEASLLALADGATRRYCPPARDHKPVGEGDTGPNTGGMGAYAPAPVVTPERSAFADRAVFDPILRGLAEEGRPFRGCLYGGLMFTADGPQVIEFNCRFGDPEAQAVLALLESDLLGHLHATATGALAGEQPVWSDRKAVCVVLAARGYPEVYETGKPIRGLAEAAALPETHVFHAGTRAEGGAVVTAGGRVLSVVGVGETFAAAAARAYAGADRIQFEGKTCRRDIGWRALARERGGTDG